MASGCTAGGEIALEIDNHLLIAALQDRIESVRRSELERFRSRLSRLDERQRGAVEDLTKGIVTSFFDDPMRGMLGCAGSPRGERMADALRDLFRL